MGALIEKTFHSPVLLEQVTSFLLTDPEGIYVDGTLGGGGHAEEICRHLSGNGRLFGFDVDEEAIRFSGERLGGERSRVTLVKGNFATIPDELKRLGVESVDGILLDLGISSSQIDRGEGGFSFRHDARLDMRMDRTLTVTGWDVVNTYNEEELAGIIRTFGEERHARRIAKRIVAARPVDSTVGLRDVVGSATSARYLNKTLARVFQAIRIEVNHELTNLETALRDSVSLLAEGGRIVVIAYHSLEDRIVKRFFRDQGNPLRALTKKPVTAAREEQSDNPRARSAKLRAAERVIG